MILKTGPRVLDFECDDCNYKWQVTTNSSDRIKPQNLLCLTCGSRNILFDVRSDTTNGGILSGDDPNF